MRYGVHGVPALPLLAVLLAGCAAINEAHRTQEAVEAKGRGDESRLDRVALVGAGLEQLVNFALTNRPSMIEARLNVRDARLAMKELAADAPILSETPWTAPKLSLDGGYSEASEGTTLRDHKWATKGDPSASISLELLIYDFGRYDAKAKAQAEKTVAAELDCAKEGYTIFNDVASAYFTFMEKRALLEVAFTNEAQYAEHLERAEARLKAGEADKLDVLKARLDLATARQTVTEASNRVDTTGATLMNALGVEASRGTWESVLGKGDVCIDSVRRGFARTTYDVEEAFGLARTNAPAISVTRANLRAASHSVDYAISDMMPSISGSASISWTDPLWYFSWGASAAQSLFTGWRKTTAVNRATVALEKAASDVDKAEQQLSVELETAIANRDNSVSAIESAMASVKSAKENLDTVREQFALGAASRVELSEAIAAHSTARGDTITAFYDGQRAEAKLFAIIGRAPQYKEEIVR